MGVLNSKIYVPVENVSDFSCYTIFDSGIIRAYSSNPNIGDNNYIDFYINSHYLSKEGVQTITSTQELPLCISTSRITNDKYYRYDISHILILVFLILFVMIVSFKVFSRMFGRWLKV